MNAFVVVLLLMGVVGVGWWIAGQRSPLRWVSGNLVCNRSRQVFAVYRIPPSSYLTQPMDEEQDIRARVAATLELLGSDYRISHVQRQFDVDTYVRRHTGMYSATGHPKAWRARLADQRETLEQRPVHRKEIYIEVRLARPDAWSPTGHITDVARQVGKLLGRKQATESQTQREAQIWQRLSKLGADRASAIEIQWLVRRCYTRGVGEPLIDDLWVPPALSYSQDEVDFQPEHLNALRLHDIEMTRPRGASRVEIQSENGLSYQTVLVLGALPSGDARNIDVLGRWLDRVAFPVDVSCQVTYRPNVEARRKVERQEKKASESFRDEYEGSETGVSEQTERLPGIAKAIRGYLSDSTRPPLNEVTILLFVGASSASELRDRVSELRDVLSGGAALHEPVNLKEAHTAGIPGAKSSMSGWEMPMTVEQVAMLHPTGSLDLGSELGPYIGHTPTQSQLPVFFDLTEAVARNKTPTLLLVGEPGAGKTMTMMYLEEIAYLQGSRIVDIDAKTDSDADEDSQDHKLARLDSVNEADIEVIDFGPERMKDGQLDPLLITQGILREAAALTFYATLLGPDSMRGDREPHLRRAIQSTLNDFGSDATSLRVIETLQATPNATAKELASMLDVCSTSQLGRIGFAKTPRTELRESGKQITQLRLWELPMPGPGLAPSDWAPDEREGEAVARLAFLLALHLCAGSNANHKVIGADEFHHYFSTDSGAGHRFFTKITRLARSRNISPILATQLLGDVDKLRGLIGATMVFRLKERDEAIQAMKLLGRTPPAESDDLDYHDQQLAQTIRDLPSGECVFEDWSGRIGPIRIDPASEGWIEKVGTNPHGLVGA